LHAIACAPSTSVVLAGGHESLVLALDVGQEAAEAVPFRQEAPTRRLRLPGGAGAAARVAWAPDGTWLAWAGADAAAPISLLNPATGQVMRAWEGLRQRFHDLAVSPDGRHVTGASASGKLHTWDARTGKPVSTLNAHQGAAVAVASSPDGRWLASGGIDGQVGVWQRSNGERRWRLAHPKAVNAVAFSPDGAWLASACDDNRVRLWSVASGQLARTLEGHTDWVTRLAFSPDGRWLASGGDDRNVRLWPLSPEGSPQLLSGHDGAISDLAFLRDGRHLVSIGGKQGALVWHLASGMVAQSLARTGEDGRLGLSPDGRTLVMTDASKEGGLAVWDVGDERRSEP
jgi:WD40 repeat protein